MDMNNHISEKAPRSRFSLTLTTVYVEALDHLVEAGLYMEYQAAIRDALRHLFRFHGIESFSDKGADLENEDFDQE